MSGGWCQSVWSDLKAIGYVLSSSTDFSKPLTANVNATKTPIIFVHGSSGNQFEWLVGWKHIADEFHEHPCWAFSMDLNFDAHTGLQEPITSFAKVKYRSRMCDRSIDDYVYLYLHRHVEYVMRKYNTQRVILFGHSMGGVVACQYKIAFPQHVERVVTLGSPLLGAPLLTNYLVKCFNNRERHRQMTPGSDLLANIQEKLRGDRDIMTVGSIHDFQVPDTHSSIFGVHHLRLSHLGHGGMISDPNVFEQIHEWFS